MYADHLQEKVYIYIYAFDKGFHRKHRQIAILFHTSIVKCYRKYDLILLHYLLGFYVAKHGDLLFDSSVQWSGTTTNNLPRRKQENYLDTFENIYLTSHGLDMK